jgi:uncharacterized protein
MSGKNIVLDTSNGVPKSQANTKVNSSIPIAELASQTIEVPYVQISGEKTSPRLTVSAGLHGSEYVGILAAHKLVSKVVPSDLESTLAVLPLVNKFAFENFTRQVNPLDGVNLNRAFPGNPNGSISYQMVYSLFNKVIMKSDYYVDLHGGEPSEFLTPFILYCETGNSRVDERTEELVRDFGIKYIWKMKSVSKIDQSSSDRPILTPDGMAAAEAAKKGIPSFIAESGTDGKLDLSYIEVLYDGLMNVMRRTGVIRGKVLRPKEAPIFSETHALVNAGTTGIKYIQVNAGDIVDEGQKLCETRSLSGEILETMVSPIHGVILSVRNNPVSRPSENIFLILGLR